MFSNFYISCGKTVVIGLVSVRIALFKGNLNRAMQTYTNLLHVYPHGIFIFFTFNSFVCKGLQKERKF